MGIGVVHDQADLAAAATVQRRARICRIQHGEYLLEIRLGEQRAGRVVRRVDIDANDRVTVRLKLGTDMVGVPAARHGVECRLELEVIQLVGNHWPRRIGHHNAPVLAKGCQARQQVKCGIETTAALVLERESRILGGVDVHDGL